MKIFGLKAILRMAMLFICFFLFFYVFVHEQFMSNPSGPLFMLLGGMTVVILRATIIVTERNLLRTYNILTFITRRPKWLLINDIQKMNIIHITGRGGGTSIHLMSRNEQVITINTQFSKADIRSFEQFMMGKGIEVQNPEK